MRVLVTGAFGYIGNAVARRLTLTGHDVIALTSRPLNTLPPFAFAKEVMRADIRDERAIRLAVSGVDAVCHLAGLSRVRDSFVHAEEYLAVNTQGTKMLLAALAADTTAAVRFVFASSVAVYGVPEPQPITEAAPLAPTSPYGVSKVKAERAVTEAAGTCGGTARLRIFNAAGAVAGVTSTDLTRVIPKALAVAVGREPCFEMSGDGTAVRDFVHVDDVAAAFSLAIDNCQPGNHAVYNVAATPASIAEVIAVAEEVTGRSIPVVRNPPRNEASLVIADCTRISLELGWKPARSSLREIVASAWDVVNRASGPQTGR